MKTEQNPTDESCKKTQTTNRTVYSGISIAFAVIIISMALIGVEKSTLILTVSVLGGALAVIGPTLMSKKNCVG